MQWGFNIFSVHTKVKEKTVKFAFVKIEAALNVAEPFVYASRNVHSNSGSTKQQQIIYQDN